MLYHLLVSLYPQIPVFNVARYITFRTAAASMTALLISLVLGPWLIRRLREFQIGQVIRQEGPQSPSRQGGHADDGRPADPGGGARADAAVGGSDQRLRLDCRARRRRRSAPSASSTTTSRSRGDRRAVCGRATRWACRSLVGAWRRPRR